MEGYAPAYLAARSPDSGETRFGVGRDVKVAQGVYDYLLQSADVLQWADAKLAQVDDWVADKLAGAVVSNLAAAASRTVLSYAAYQKCGYPHWWPEDDTAHCY